MDLHRPFLVMCVTCMAISQDTTSSDVNIEPSVLDEIENSTAQFRCSHKGNGIRIRWTRGKDNFDYEVNSCKELSTSANNRTTCTCQINSVNATVLLLQISNISSSDHNTSYKCVVFYVNKKEEKNTILYVKVPVKTLDISPIGRTIETSENTSISLNCSSYYSRPSPAIKWIVTDESNKKLQYMGQQTNFTNQNGFTSATSILVYRPDRTVNGWMLYCVVLATDGQPEEIKSSFITLNIKYPPESNLMINGNAMGGSYDVNENETGTLNCTITGGNPKPFLSWNKCFDNENYTRWSSFPIEESQTIMLTWRAIPYTNRNCTCMSMQEERNDSVSITINILRPAIVRDFFVDGHNRKPNVTINESDSVTFICNVDSNTNSDTSIRYTNGTSLVRSLSNSLNYTIKSTTCLDTGAYLCYAKNKHNIGNGSRKQMYLFVRCSPRAHPNFKYKENITSELNEVAVLHFPFLAYPIPDSVIWQKYSSSNWLNLTSEDSITNISKSQFSSSLTINNVTENYIGKYRLAITNAIGSFTQNFFISAKVPVKTLDIMPVEKVIQISENKSISINCTSSYSRPTPVIKWVVTNQIDKTLQFFGQQTHFTKANGLSSAASTFHYRPDRTVNGWIVYCLVSKTDVQLEEIRSSLITLDITYPPETRLKINGYSMGGSYDVIGNETGTLNCTITGGNPKPFLTWNKCFNNENYTRLSSFPTEDSQTNILSWRAIPNTDRNCTCMSTQRERNDSESINVNILYPATIIEFLVDKNNKKPNENDSVTNVFINENDSVTFICNVDSNPISDTSLRFTNDTFLVLALSNSLNYTFESATCLDTGAYFCYAKNKHNIGNGSREQLFLFVRCSPRANPNFKYNENITSALNEVAVLHFPILAYPIPDSVTWQKYSNSDWLNLTSDDRNINISKSNINSSLTISNVTEKYFGKYRLVITNDVGSFTQNFFISTKGRPKPPTGFRVINELTTNTSVTVQWISSFDGGYPQHFVLKYSKANQNKWLTKEITDQGFQVMSYKIKGLSSDSVYSIFLQAVNSIGPSELSEIIFVRTKEKSLQKDNYIIRIVIGGVCGVVGIAVVFVTFVTCYFRKRRNERDSERTTYKNGQNFELKKEIKCTENYQTLPTNRRDTVEYSQLHTSRKPENAIEKNDNIQEEEGGIYINLKIQKCQPS